MEVDCGGMPLPLPARELWAFLAPPAAALLSKEMKLARTPFFMLDAIGERLVPELTLGALMRIC